MTYYLLDTRTRRVLLVGLTLDQARREAIHRRGTVFLPEAVSSPREGA